MDNKTVRQNLTPRTVCRSTGWCSYKLLECHASQQTTTWTNFEASENNCHFGIFLNRCQTYIPQCFSGYFFCSKTQWQTQNLRVVLWAKRMIYDFCGVIVLWACNTARNGVRVWNEFLWHTQSTSLVLSKESINQFTPHKMRKAISRIFLKRSVPPTLGALLFEPATVFEDYRGTQPLLDSGKVWPMIVIVFMNNAHTINCPWNHDANLLVCWII